MRSKQRATPQTQPPQFDHPQPSDPTAIEMLESQTGYARQLWAGIRFDSQTAEDISFEQLIVRGASFQHAELPLLQASDCRFDSADFASCVLNKAYFRRVELLGCRLMGMTLTDADLADVRFSRCNLSLARCWSSTYRTVRFEHCSLQEASFDGSDLSGAIFTKCDLTKADLRNTKLKQTDLRGSIITGIQINAKDLAGAIIDPSQAIELIHLLGVIVQPEDV